MMSPQLLMLMLCGTLQCSTTQAQGGLRQAPILQPDPQFQFDSHFSQNAFQNSNARWGSNSILGTHQSSIFAQSNVNKDEPKIENSPFSNSKFPQQNSPLLPPSQPFGVFQRQPGGFPTLPPRRDSFPTLPPRKSGFPTQSPRQPRGPFTSPPIQSRTLAPLQVNQPNPSQCYAQCYAGWTKNKMALPPQLAHMFGTCEKKNETTEEEDYSWGSVWGAVSGSKPEQEVLIGVEPQCSNGRCWCPQLHVCDTNTGRCVNQNSVFQDCNDSQFKCISGKCIEGHLRCDGLSNCLDGSDEIDCSQHTCLSHQHTCDDGICVNYHDNVICNSILDCFDGSDEAVCDASQECASNQFQCVDSGKCLFEDWRCDGFPDCPDASDELDCLANCSAAQWRCADGLSCIPGWKKCDFTHDCLDGSDEKSCVVCTVDQFTCTNSSVKCVPKDSVCNYEWDCDDGSDELQMNCKNAGRGGNLDWIVDRLISKINPMIHRWTKANIDRIGNEVADPIFKKLKGLAPGSIQPYLSGMNITKIRIDGIENVFKRKKEAWVHIENKEITFKGTIATNRIVVRAEIVINTADYQMDMGYLGTVNIPTPDIHGVAGVRTDGFEVGLNVKMLTEDCAKPRLHSVSSSGNLQPILTLESMASLIETIAAGVGHDFDNYFKEFLRKQVTAIHKDMSKNLENAFNEVVKKIGDSTCIRKPISNLGEKVETALNTEVWKMIANL